MKDSELIFGLIASFSHRIKQSFSFEDLEYLTKPFKISSSNLRTNLSRMNKKEMIEITRKGKFAFYSFGKKGRSISKNVSIGFKTLDWTGWDGAWRGILFSIPEEEKNIRHKIRKKLGYYRFIPWYPGFWIRPLHSEELIHKNLKEFLEKKWISIIRFFPETTLPDDGIKLNWELKEINQEYKYYIQLIKDKLGSLNSLNPEQALIEMMKTGDRVVKSLFKDPILPKEFLPEDWEGENIRKLFFRWNKEVREYSKPYWNKILIMEEYK